MLCWKKCVCLFMRNPLISVALRFYFKRGNSNVTFSIQLWPDCSTSVWSTNHSQRNENSLRQHLNSTETKPCCDLQHSPLVQALTLSCFEKNFSEKMHLSSIFIKELWPVPLNGGHLLLSMLTMSQQAQHQSAHHTKTNWMDESSDKLF